MPASCPRGSRTPGADPEPAPVRTVPYLNIGRPPGRITERAPPPDCDFQVTTGEHLHEYQRSRRHPRRGTARGHRIGQDFRPNISTASVCAGSGTGNPNGQERYVRDAGRFAYFWAWPMMNMHNRRIVLEKLPEPGLMGGIVPVAPPNRLAMLRDYIEPQERLVACPNQDVVYGFGLLSLDRSPVILQVPDFKDRFWVYQVVDQRTDSFAELGAMYGTEPGFYLLVGPGWNGTAPAGIAKVFRSPTNLGVVIPRAFVTDEAADKHAVQALISQINAYPLAEFDGRMKTKDWGSMPTFPNQSQGEEETKWVIPESFFNGLSQVLDEVPPLPGEAAIYANIRAVLAAAAKDDRLKASLKRAAIDADRELVTPLFQFHNSGLPLPNNWTTITNGAAFGIDYLTRTAAAKSNIFVNKGNETRYFYLDSDAQGGQLSGSNKYTVTFAKGMTPPVQGFWSLTLYNEHHFFAPNDIKRYSLGTKNKNLKYGANGSLTLYVQANAPSEELRANWLPLRRAPLRPVHARILARGGHCERQLDAAPVNKVG